MAFPASSPTEPSVGVPRWLAIVVAIIAVVAILGPALVVAYPPAIPVQPRSVAAPTRVVPPAELPPVEPVAFQNLSRDDARAWNAAIPFSTDPNPPARPFRLTGTEADRARAIDCLAAAVWYEAGDDPTGQRAVAQVVINRARHPAFPKTICGVVFQGQERRTGCQFTFTCDGAMTRVPDPAAWARAQGVATDALTGSVFAKVGHSTHYHTDWVVPYWSASLDKVAEVHTHLFFRWTGWWGTPPAFRRTVADSEPLIPKLAALSTQHDRTAQALDEAAVATAAADALLAQLPQGAAVSGDGVYLVTLAPKLTPDRYAAFATATCGTRDYCKLLAWKEKRDTPGTLPATPAQMQAMAFSYLRDKAKGFDKALWNCQLAKRPDARDCMKTVAMMPQKPVGAFRLEALPGGRTGLTVPAVTPSATPTPRASATPRAGATGQPL